MRRLTAARAVRILAALATAAAPAGADWLVYVGGDLQETKGAWATGTREVVFYAPGGVMQSIAAEDVDLPTSAFITWQVGGRRQVPALAPQPPAPAEPGAPAPAEAPCLPVRVVGIPTAETFDLAVDGRPETVHLACLDAPEPQYDLADLAWFGQAAGEAVGGLVRAAKGVCLTEEEPPRRDGQGHRIVFLATADGRDLGAEVIARGLGLVRAGACSRGEGYRTLEKEARGEERGHWGRTSTNAAFAAVTHGLAGSAGAPALPRRARGGGG